MLHEGNAARLSRIELPLGPTFFRMGAFIGVPDGGSRMYRLAEVLTLVLGASVIPGLIGASMVFLAHF